MNVLLVSHHYPPDGVAGVERVTQSLAFELVQNGDVVAVAARRITYSPSLHNLREQLPDGITVYRYTGGEFSRETARAFYQELDTLFVGTLEEFKPDVVHIQHLRGLSPRFIELAHQAGAAVVLSLHDYYFACPRITLLKPSGEVCGGPEGGTACAQTCFGDQGPRAERWKLRARYFQALAQTADRIICPSHYVADFFVQQGAADTRVRVVPNGISLAASDAWSDFYVECRPNALNLLYLGAVMPHKGVHLILDALEQAQLDTVDLVVAGVGDYAYIARLRECAARIPGLRLRFYGEYEVERVPFLLRGVDYVITPSIWPEAFGIAPREALRLGVPVIVSRVGGLSEVVSEGTNGFTFAPEQPAELAGLLRRLATEQHLSPHLRAGARATPILTQSEHATAVRQVYVEARQEFEGSAVRVPDGSLQELGEAWRAAEFDSNLVRSPEV